MHLDAGVFAEPVEDFLFLVGGVVVHHQAQFVIGVSACDMFEEGQEFLVAVARFADPGDLAGGDVQGGEQGGGAVADVVVGLAFRDPDLHGQCGRGAIQGLDLAFRAPRGAALLDGGERTPSLVCRSRPGKLRARESPGTMRHSRKQ